MVAGRIRRADSFADRFVGLMGRRAIDPEEGLLLPDTSSIHMFFMRTAIDCLFLAAPDNSGEQRVVALRQRLAPWRGIVWYIRGARDCLELAPGTLERAGLRQGALVRLVEADAS
jgi:uncharacterized membrane protein (UPF0127 family)